MRPSNDGCERCGRVDCRAKEGHVPHHVGGNSDGCPACECDGRPAVDWRALYFSEAQHADGLYSLLGQARATLAHLLERVRFSALRRRRIEQEVIQPADALLATPAARRSATDIDPAASGTEIK